MYDPSSLVHLHHGRLFCFPRRHAPRCSIVLRCIRIANFLMRHFPAPAGQPEMMRNAFMRTGVLFFSPRAALRMKLYGHKKAPPRRKEGARSRAHY